MLARRSERPWPGRDSGSDGRVGSGAAGAATPVARRPAYDHVMAATGFDLAELYGSVLAGSMRGEFEPRRFFEGFSSQVRRLIAHDRLMLAYLEEAGRTLSVFGEHAAGGPLRHEGHYTTTCDPGSRYTCDEIGHVGVFAGQPEMVRDATTAAAVTGPMLGTVRRRWTRASWTARCSIASSE